MNRSSCTTAADVPNGEPLSGRHGYWQLFKNVHLRLVLLALVITLTHVCLATLSGRGATWSSRYQSLWTFDGGWYADIVQHGYRTASPPGAGAQYNVAFFPAYPLAASVVRRILGLTPGVALLITAQLAAVLFWYVILRLLHRWQVAPGMALAVIILLFCQPGAFYLVVSYSESLFMASLLMLLMLGPRARGSVRALAGAAMAGYAMSATRIVGAPLAVLPLLWAFDDVRKTQLRPTFRLLLQRVRPHAFIAIATAMGTISFFIYCAARFGRWNEYMKAREIGWFGTHADYSALFALERFRVFVPQFSGDFLAHADVTRLYVPMLAALLLLVVGADSLFSRRGSLRGFGERVPFYVAAGILFFLSATNANPTFQSSPGFIRYGIYTCTLLFLAAAHAYENSNYRNRPLPLAVQLAIFLTATVGLALQLQLCWQYSRGIFVS
ncbi:MAG: hypothetical protein H0W20_07170 [Chthoniobacterales bacterium]|nr:hypothetical protein [Chthoniobacterales bacterium]